MTGGWTDLPLTAHGQEQAIRTADRVRRMLANSMAAVFTSDLRRAAMTAEAIGHALDARIYPMPELRELNNGSAAGLSLADARKLQLPQEGDPLDWRPYPGAETWREMTARLMSALEHVAHRSPGMAVVVAHANCGVAVVRWWLGLRDLDQHRISFDLDCCGITDLVENEWGERTVRRLNDVSHLETPCGAAG
jgi:probable phosphoglycerate mutase